MTLAILKSAGQVFCTMSLSLSFHYFFLMVGWRLWVWGRISQQRSALLVTWQQVRNITMIDHCGCATSSFGYDSIWQISPLYSHYFFIPILCSFEVSKYSSHSKRVKSILLPRRGYQRLLGFLDSHHIHVHLRIWQMHWWGITRRMLGSLLCGSFPSRILAPPFLAACNFLTFCSHPVKLL